MKKLIIFILFNLTILFAQEKHFKIHEANVYNYPYLIKKYGLKQAKIIVYRKWRRITYISQKDFELLKKTYKTGKIYNLQFTLAAILWQESDIGHYLHNFEDPSCGNFHKLLPELCKDNGLKPNMWNMSRACDKLMNYDFAVRVAINDLLKRKNKYELLGYPKYKVWRKMVSGYNGSGFNSKVYLDQIRLNIFYLHQIQAALEY